MANVLLLLSSIFVLAMVMPAEDTDEANVRKSVEQFSTAADKQDVQKMRKVLHAEAQQFFVGPEGLMRLETEAYLGMLEQKQIGGQPRKLKIQSVDVNGDMASVKATMSNKAYHFDNYFSLMKIDGKWQIVSVVLRMQQL